MQVLGEQTPVIHQILHQLRDTQLQQDPLRFERNLELLGTLLGYELSEQLSFHDTSANTPLGKAKTAAPSDKLVLAAVLRAGLPVQHGIHQILPTAELAFVGAARREDSGSNVTVDLSYLAAPGLKDKVLIMADTMLATGQSLVEAYRALVKAHGAPKQVLIAAVIASQAGIDHIKQQLPEAELFICAVDPKLDDHAYIVPGLGDAGDLLYGPKQ